MQINLTFLSIRLAKNLNVPTSSFGKHTGKTGSPLHCGGFICISEVQEWCHHGRSLQGEIGHSRAKGPVRDALVLRVYTSLRSFSNCLLCDWSNSSTSVHLRRIKRTNSVVCGSIDSGGVTPEGSYLRSHT